LIIMIGASVAAACEAGVQLENPAYLRNEMTPRRIGAKQALAALIASKHDEAILPEGLLE
jgi:hypothetical protein